MESPIPFRLTTRQCDPMSPFLKAPCSSYQAPSTSTFHDGRTLSRHKSLPIISSAMYSTASSPRGKLEKVKRTDSTNSLRRSVSGMKSLLPLKLSSSRPSSSCNTPRSIERSTFGLEQLGDLSTLRALQQLPERRFNATRPMTMGRERYRDTPVYNEPGSPGLNLAYYTDEEVCLKSSLIYSCDRPLLTSCYASSSSESEDGNCDDLDEGYSLPEGRSSADMNRASPRSDLSFACRGDSRVLDKSVFCNEGAWLSSPFKKWNHHRTDSLPKLMAEGMPVGHDIEGGWLSDTSSIFGDDSYACATALAPARANVIEIEVNSHRLSIKIPPRSSSLVGTRPQSLNPDEGWKFRSGHSLDFNSDHQLAEDYSTAMRPWLSQLSLSNNSSDISLPSPPLSPIDLGAIGNHTTMNWQRDSDSNSHAYGDGMTSSPVSARDSISQIISDLDESISEFPSSNLLPGTPCISAIRTYRHRINTSHPQWDVPVALGSPFAEGVDWRPRPTPFPPQRRPKTSSFASLHRTFSSRTSKTVPDSKKDWSNQAQDVVDVSLHPDQHDSVAPHVPTAPSLHPFNAIFPDATYHLQAALYAHILAYLFVTSLSTDYSIPNINTPPHSPKHLPYYSTTSLSIPQKAADRLGIAISTERTRKINVGGDAIILRRSGTENGMLAGKLEASIGWLVDEMSDDRQQSDVGTGKVVDATFLRALGEIVKACERDCFGYR